jgi:HD-GYP domain-containing protein (c-di-GMP phosphodiesterase class II)
MHSKLQAIMNVGPMKAPFSRNLAQVAHREQTGEPPHSLVSPQVSATIHALLRTLAARDPYTAHHSIRVTEIATCFALHLGLSSREIAILQNGVILHDIGKIGISDAILHKPGLLTPEERAIITTHPLIGELIVEPLQLGPGEREIILLHHERWDGTGYPRGIAGLEIPFLCRLTMLADVYDAMISDRPYRPRFPMAQALGEIESQAGRHFDPELTGKFVAFLASAWQKIPGGLHLPARPAVPAPKGRSRTRTSVSPPPEPR